MNQMENKNKNNNNNSSNSLVFGRWPQTKSEGPFFGDFRVKRLDKLVRFVGMKNATCSFSLLLLTFYSQTL